MMFVDIGETPGKMFHLNFTKAEKYSEKKMATASRDMPRRILNFLIMLSS